MRLVEVTFEQMWKKRAGLPRWCSGKESVSNAGDLRDADSIPGLERSLGVGSGNPLQYSWEENSMDRGVWQAIVHGIPKSQPWLNTHILKKVLEVRLSRVQPSWKLSCQVQKQLIQFSSVQSLSCVPTLCDSMNRSTPVPPVHQQLPESTQTHVHRINDATQPSHPLSSPSPPTLSLSQNQGLFKWVRSSHQVAKVLEFQPQHQPFQWTPRTDLL